MLQILDVLAACTEGTVLPLPACYIFNGIISIFVGAFACCFQQKVYMLSYGCIVQYTGKGMQLCLLICAFGISEPLGRGNLQLTGT